MRARITQGIARRIAKLVNPLLDAEEKAAAKSREHVAATKEQQLSIARYYLARTYGVDSLAESEREKLTKAQWSILLGMPIQYPNTPEGVAEWERRCIESQQRLLEEVRK